MKTIFKYKLPRDGQSITIDDYVIEWLRPGVQNGWPHIWAVVDPDRNDMETEIVAWGTGWPLPDDVYYGTDYLGTCEDGAGYVWHYFAATRTSDQTTTTVQDYSQDYYHLDKLQSTPCDNWQTITISCDSSANRAIDSLVCDGDYDPTISTSCTAAVSTNTYNDNVKINFIEYLNGIEGRG